MWWLVVLLGACGTTAAPPTTCAPQDGNASGTQLHVAWLISDDGTCVASGIEDTNLKLPCAPALWSDGNEYCTPMGAVGAVYPGMGCQSAVGGTTQGAPVVERDAHGRIDRMWLAGTGPAMTMSVQSSSSQDASGTCESCPFETTCPGTVTFYPLGLEVARTALVATTTAPEGSDRYQPTVTRGADGLQIQASIQAFDTTLGTTCTAQVYRDGSACVPPGLGESVGFTDAACTSPLLHADGAPPSFTRNWTECPTQRPRFLATGDEVAAPSQLFIGQDNSGQCVAGTPVATGHYYAQQDTDALDIAREPEGGDRRLQVIHYAHQANWRDQALFDSELGVDCLPVTAHDGVPRCVPIDVAIADVRDDGVSNDYYLDAACTQQVVLATYAPGFACAPVTDVPYARAPDGAYWRVTGTTTCAQLFRPGFDGSKWNCLPLGCEASPYAPTEYFLLDSAALPDDTFAALRPL